MPPDPNEMKDFWEVAGAFLAGLLGLRGVQVLKAKGGSTLDDLAKVIREEHSETRETLNELNTRIQVLAAVMERLRE